MSRLRLEWIAIASLTACGATPTADTSAGRPTTASPAAPAAATEPAVAEPPASPVAAAVPVAPPALPTAADAGACPATDDRAYGILVSPQRPAVGQPMRVLAATLAGEEALALRVDGGAAPSDMRFWTGAPAAALATVTPDKPGELVIVAGRGGVGKACLKVKVRERAGRDAPPPASTAVWPSQRAWDSGEEALYSAWVRALFHAEPGVDLAYTALDQVTRDPARNILHDAYAWGEDAAPQQGGLHMRPDCADTPYFLRAYYSWKRALPFAFRGCSRGGPGKPPRCGEATSNLAAPGGSGPQPGQLGAVQHFMRRTLAWGVHTGNGRVALGDERSDLYPVRLDRRSLRPGTVYADPYGHILVLVELFAGEGGRPGVLYAVDGQPDGSITRKRFWEGNFLWNPDPLLGGSGFKNFRPITIRDGAATPLSDAEIAAHADYGDLSQEQGSLTAPAFYDRMEAIVSPGTRDPVLALEEAVAALFEQARVRVTSVGNGDAFFKQSPGATIAMPDGFAVFETTGSWESYSTPARDLRLLIAIDVVRGFADKVRRQPAVFAAEQDLEGTVRRLEEARDKLLADPKFRFEYVRSDGSKWPLGLAELVTRARALEVAYNPNDCPEYRWGAPAGSEEARTCSRRAPNEQQAKMERYREWFSARKRPARGT
ncbi:hypothetical protein [Nannocystis pusilla]|uniref:hypothetical protein n=1 Tax=Nannocystis pusilla TaxID=889268 RepID=UPI003BF17709